MKDIEAMKEEPRFSRDDYCSKHGGWCGEGIPCKVCGVIGQPNSMPEIPSGLTYEEALLWGAEQIRLRLTAKQ